MTHGKKTSIIRRSIRMAKKSGNSPLRGMHNPLTKAPKNACIPMQNYTQKNIYIYRERSVDD